MKVRVLLLLVAAAALLAFRTWYFLQLGNWLWLMLITATMQFAVVVAGIIAMERRPESRTGLILLSWGFFVAATGPGTAESGVLLVLESSLQPWYWILLAHAMLTYPDGRTRHSRERAFLIIGYLWPLWWFVPWLIAEPGWQVNCPVDGCPANPVLIRADRVLLDLWGDANGVLAIGMGLWFLVLVILRRRAMAQPERRSAAPALWAIGALLAAYLMKAALPLLRVSNGTLWEIMWWTQRLSTFLVPLGLLIALVNTKLARADVAALLLRLRSGDIAELQASLAKLVRDPSLCIAKAVPPGYDDEVTQLGDGYVLLHHRSARTEDAELFDAGVAAARLTIENASLSRRVQAQLAEVSASRERLVHAADAERKRVERDLHDGAQQQLIGVGMALETARLEVGDAHPAAPMLDDATGRLRQSIDDLRGLARGLRPAMLSERGLPTALAELRRRAKVPVTLQIDAVPRLASEIETTAYFVVSEALQNATRHAPGANVRVQVRFDGGELVVAVSDDGPGGADSQGGTGLRGLADRVAVTGGVLTVQSPPGKGTLIEARIPVPREE